MNSKLIKISPSSLNLFLECRLCFWLYENEGIKRPEGVSSSLSRGMDLLIKNYFDKYRAKGKLPPELVGKVEGKLLNDQLLINRWRSRGEGLRYEDKELNAILLGLLDECFINSGFYIPVDYKTRGFKLKDNSFSFHQVQLNCYTFLLEINGYKTPSFGYLIYYIPEEIRENGEVRFRIEPQRVPTNPLDALKLFREAVLFLQGPKPELHNNCEFCLRGQQLFGAH